MRIGRRWRSRHHSAGDAAAATALPTRALLARIVLIAEYRPVRTRPSCTDQLFISSTVHAFTPIRLQRLPRQPLRLCDYVTRTTLRFSVCVVSAQLFSKTIKSRVQLKTKPSSCAKPFCRCDCHRRVLVYILIA